MQQSVLVILLHLPSPRDHLYILYHVKVGLFVPFSEFIYFTQAISLIKATTILSR